MGYPGTTFTLTDGEPVVQQVGNQNQMHAWWVKPAAGDTVRVRFKVAEGADWETYGSYTAFYSDHVVAPVWQLEFQRTSGSGTTSTCGVA